ncbi:MFS transporter [Amycolatopsis panacis]|uniref:MFS transporter n=1 Tax=Amycolatopsis panacis TaxID=2340917 RepID=A0A419I2B7_9PSEU|nr:MFS transporter [Amycolatopsis panacis]RJQ83995.1 MFS transporter [Amycolatopsis panacis]
MQKKALGAAMAGHIVESFDFIIYGYSATILAKHFFPSANPALALLSTLAIYGVAFIVRPLGGAVFGSMGDRLGRRTALCTVVLIMAVSTGAIGVLPTYAAAGIVAPVLLLLCRLGQGLSMGAEYTSAASYVMEQAPPSRRGRWISAVGGATFIGAALAVFLLLGLQLSAAGAYADWSWRVPFLVGGAIALIGLYMRLRLAESRAFTTLAERGETTSTPVRDSLRNWRVFLLLLVIFALLALVSQNFLGYLPTYLTVTGRLAPVTVLVASGIALVLCTGLSLLTGVLADRFGRKPLLVAGVVAAVLGSVPAYLVAAGGSLATTVIAEILLVIPAAVVGITATMVAVELVPVRIRATSTALTYNISYAVFGGTAPFVGALITAKFGKLAPGAYITIIAALALVVVLVALPETKNRLMPAPSRSDDPDFVPDALPHA